ncbi:MAG: acetate--CoA ligase family protein [Chloroflexi bacterium]|nr:acetate--CoA ligase family protein [Chloroflexota bacterium]
MSNVRSLLRPGSVAIVGDSPGPGRGGVIHDQLVRWGYDGAIYPVNPKYPEVKGLTCYPSLLDIPEPVELVVVALGASHALRVMRECVEKQVRAAIFIASGFAEAGQEGRQLQEEIRRLALAHGIAACGPNCYGIANLHGRFAAYSGSLAESMRPGPVALLFQSGALTHSVTDPAVLRGIGFSSIITAGNEAVTELADYLDAIADDPHTRVVACFVEGFKEPARFIAAARKAIAADKRLVVLKVGRSEPAKRAALAHTGSLAGEDRVYDALFRQLGIVRAHDLDELIETAELLSHHRRVAPGNTAVVSISGGSCGIMADLAQDLGLEIRAFSPETAEALRQAIPAFATVNNPLDLTGAVAEDRSILHRALGILARDPAVSLVALALNTPVGGDEAGRSLYRDMARVLVEHAQSSDTPHALFSMSSGPYDLEIARMAREAGVPALQGMRESLAAIARVQRATAALGRLRDAGEIAGPASPEVVRLIRQAATSALTERESKAVLAAAGIPVTREALANDPEEAVRLAGEIGYPVALKVDSPDILHKTDAGCVRLGLAGADAVRKAYREVLANARRHRPDARIGGVLVQEMVGGGVETLIGVTNHRGLGPAVVFGLGGLLVEALEDVVMRMAPLTVGDAREMVQEIRAARVLQGFRGGPPADVDALVGALVRLSRLAWWLRDEIAEIDVNPLVVFPAGRGVRAVDALIVRVQGLRFPGASGKSVGDRLASPPSC